jgi:hypothetical protein
MLSYPKSELENLFKKFLAQTDLPDLAEKCLLTSIVIAFRKLVQLRGQMGSLRTGFITNKIIHIRSFTIYSVFVPI